MLMLRKRFKQAGSMTWCLSKHSPEGLCFCVLVTANTQKKVSDMIIVLHHTKFHVCCHFSSLLPININKEILLLLSVLH